MEIWSINQKGLLVCHLTAKDRQDVDEKMIKLDKSYPNRVFIITRELVARRVVDGKVVFENVYG